PIFLDNAFMRFRVSVCDVGLVDLLDGIVCVHHKCGDFVGRFLISPRRGILDHVVKNSCERSPFDKPKDKYLCPTLFRPVKTHGIRTIILWDSRTLFFGKGFVCRTFVFEKKLRELSAWLKHTFRCTLSWFNLIIPVFLWPLAHMRGHFWWLTLGSKIDGSLA